MRLIFMIFLSCAMAACSLSKPKSETPNKAPQQSAITMQPVRPDTYMPRAIVYRTDGDYAGNVPVRFNAQRKMLISFPAPTDLMRECEPIHLADGWMLDRIGISANTVYTRYSIGQYRNLPATPAITQLIDSIIPGSGITELVELPFTTAQALTDTAECNRLIRSGFPGCRIIKR